MNLSEPKDFIGKRERIEVSRSIVEVVEKLEMLQAHGFKCKLERHVGFWLLHHEFPRLKLVPSGHVVLSSKE